MIERLIFLSLKQGLTEMLADPRLLEVFFREEMQLGAEEIASVKKYFLANPPSIIHHYPRPVSKLPLWSIVLNNELESDRIIGNDAGMRGILGENEVDKNSTHPDRWMDPKDPYAGHVRLWSTYMKTYYVYTYVDDMPDICRYYYELSKNFLTRARPAMHRAGLIDTAFAGGDIAPDEKFIPAHLFVRQLSFSCKYAETAVGQKLPVFSRIEGIHIAGAPEDSPVALGGVITKLKPY